MHKTFIKNIALFWRHTSYIVKQKRTASMSQYKILFTQNFHIFVSQHNLKASILTSTHPTPWNVCKNNFHYIRLRSYLLTLKSPSLNACVTIIVLRTCLNRKIYQNQMLHLHSYFRPKSRLHIKPQIHTLFLWRVILIFFEA